MRRSLMNEGRVFTPSALFFAFALGLCAGGVVGFVAGFSIPKSRQLLPEKSKEFSSEMETYEEAEARIRARMEWEDEEVLRAVERATRRREKEEQRLREEAR
jgi:hypothetical protein